jgi:hypothetical protein
MTERVIAAFPGDRIAVVVVAVAGVAIVVFVDYGERGNADSPCQVCG